MGNYIIPPQYLDKFLNTVDFPEDYINDCWLWLNSRSKLGYGQFRLGHGYRTSAHRAAYILMVGDDIGGLDIDHLCRNPSCVNPSHLEAVTSRENTIRGTSPPATNVKKKECLRGHKYTRENTKTNKTGGRSCRECGRAKWRTYYYKRKGTEENGKWSLKIPR